ncbi:MAG TPA: DUF3570 domain-containing protein [Lacunisphaera sp.]|jgi:hypothetical protein|nr:DUF3570 domain-containing protein [Lacunisphaera sp.]
MPNISARSSAAPGILLGVALLLSQPRAARAENSVTYKYEDYRESDGRIVVKTQNALVEQDLGPDMHLKVQGVIDAIAGATPNGQPAPAGSDQVPLTNLTERRKAWNADFARQFAPLRIELGVANSRERDYVSTGWSVNTLTDFNQKNTTLLAGLAGTDDDVKVFYQAPWAKKRSHDLIAGVTQLLDPQTSVTFNLTWGRSTGYLNDQYKLVEKRMEVAPGVFLPFTFGENRPDHRTRWIALAGVNRAFPEQHGAIDASYRFYHDTFGTDAHTIEIHWLQRLGQQFILEPEFRWYDQTAANFYHYRLDDTAIVPVSGPPRPQGPFYSSDYRLSSLRTTLVGLKAVWTPAPHWQIDGAIERYDMRGNDGRTPQSAYPRATMLTGGARFSW